LLSLIVATALVVVVVVVVVVVGTAITLVALVPSQ
jgi:hypothetical protein